jgi:hypothetical protein
MSVALDPQWEGRRRVIYATLLACLLLSIYAISKDSATATAVVPPMSVLAGIVVTAYIGGAAFEASKGVPGGNVVTTTTTAPASTTTTTTPTPGAPAP